MRALILISSMISFSVFACPDLSGTYQVCTNSNGQESEMSKVVIEQKVINKITHYTIRSQDPVSGDEREENYIADGKLKITSTTDSDTGTVVRTETRASCQSNFLNLSLGVTIDGQSLAKIATKVSKEGSALIQVFSGDSMGEAVSYTSVCQ